MSEGLVESANAHHSRTKIGPPRLFNEPDNLRNQGSTTMSNE